MDAEEREGIRRRPGGGAGGLSGMIPRDVYLRMMLTLAAIALPLGILLARLTLPREIVLPVAIWMTINVLVCLLVFVFLPYSLAAQ